MIRRLLIIVLTCFFAGASYSIVKLDSIYAVFINEDSLGKMEIAEEIPYEVYISDIELSDKMLTEALQISSVLKSDISRAEILSKLAILNQLKGDYNLSIQKNLEAIEVFESLGMMKEVGGVYGSMGFSIKNYDLDLAIKYMRTGMYIVENNVDSSTLNSIYNNYGVLKKNKNELDSALFYYHKSLDLVRLMKDSIGIPYSLNNIAEIKMFRKNYEVAEKLIEEGYTIRLLKNDHYGIIDSELYYGDLFFEQGNYPKAIEYYNKAFEKCNVSDYLHLKKYALERLSVCYEKNGIYDKAYAFRMQFDALKDSLLNEAKNNEISRLQIQFETVKKDREIAEKNAEVEKQKLLAEEERKRKNYLYVGIALLTILGAFLFNRFRVTRRQNMVIQQKNKEVEEQRKITEFQKELLEEKNKEVRDSILYAERIQMALLKSDQNLSGAIPDHFILFKPKDIVSGDFFWILEKEQHIYIAVADCTGHGVPGAFLTMLGTSFLNEINAHEHLLSPAEILDALRSRIIKELSQKGNEGDSKDGMDISLVRIDPANENIEWAGANNSVYVVSNGEIIEIKADKQPIGYYAEMNPFTNNTMKLSKGDVIYLFTDGFPDQFGGESLPAGKAGGKKYKYKPFKNKLLSISNESMKLQEQMLDTEFENWRGSLEQIDDVCIIGVRV